MGRYSGSVCRLCRRNKNKLFLKGDKCTTKCVLERGKRKNTPGQQSRGRIKKMSEYGRHLVEKQKLKYLYRLGERQLRNYFSIASKKKGLTGENLLLLLERRLDNILCKMGFASSIKFANQLILHRHVIVNGRMKSVPAYLVKPGDSVQLKDKMKENIFIKKNLERAQSIPSWLEVDKNTFTGKMVSLPTRQDVSFPIDESLIVEFYSR